MSLDDPDYPGLRIAGAFVELNKYLDKLAEVVPYAQDQEIVRLRVEIKRQALSLGMADLKDKIEEVKWVAEELVPRFFMGAFAVALAATYESAVTEVADYVCAKARAKLKISDLREPSTHKKINLYLESVIGDSYALGSELKNRLDELSSVRNCIAHANGNLANSKNANRLKDLQAFAGTGRGVSIKDNYLVVSERFARQYLEHAANALNVLLNQVHDKYGIQEVEK